VAAFSGTAATATTPTSGASGSIVQVGGGAGFSTATVAVGARSPRPAVAGDTLELWSRLAPWRDQDAPTGYTLLRWLDGIGNLLQPIDDLVRDTPSAPGWASVFDPQGAGANLPWQGQFVGVQVDTSLPVAAQRAQVIAEDGFSRGTTAALIATAQRYLTGAKSVVITERDATIGAVPTPGSTGIALATTGGTLPASTALNYRVAGRNAVGTTLAGPEGATATTGSTTATNAATVTWSAVTGATSYDVYGRTPGGEGFLANVTGTTYTDTGAAVPGAALPTMASTVTALAAAYALTVSIFAAQVGASTYGQGQATYATYATANAGQATYAAAQGPIGEVVAALRAAKPAGLVLQVNILSGLTYAALTAAQPTYSALRTAYPTYGATTQSAPAA
jgi:hypothetical protein